MFIHGVLVNVFGLGLLITGDAGVGKTSCGLELARRGHVWIADDLVRIMKKGKKLVGAGFGSTGYQVVLRDRGLVFLDDIEGPIQSIQESQVDLWCELGTTSVTLITGKKRRMMNVSLAFARFPALRMSANTPSLIEQWVKTAVSEKELP